MNHVSFTVSNLEKSVEFYKNVLNFECISIAERSEEFSSAVTGIDDVAMKIAYMTGPNCTIELIQYTNGEGNRLNTKTNNIGSSHICFSVADYDNWLQRMKKHNVKFRGKLCVVPAGPNKGKRVCYMMDNDGNNLEFIEDTSVNDTK